MESPPPLMNHDEAWHFIQLGKYIERACNLCVLLDAYFVVDKHADDLDWVGLLSSCAAFEAYCKACTAELKPERIANFLLLKPGVSVFGPLFAGPNARGFDCNQRPFFEPQDRKGRKVDRAFAIDGRLRTGRTKSLRDCTNILRQSSTNAANCMRRFTNSTSSIRLRLLSKTNVLRHSPFHALSLQPSRLAEHDGSSHAPQKRRQPALFCFSVVGQSASPHFWLYRFLWQSGAPLRLAFPPRPAHDHLGRSGKY